MVSHASSRIVRREINLDAGEGDDGGDGGDHTYSSEGGQDTHGSYTYTGHQGSAPVETAAGAAVMVTGGENEDGWATHLDTSTNRWYHIHGVTGESQWAK